MNQCSQVSLESLDSLKDYVNVTLCNQNLLRKDAFPLTQRILRRHGLPCAMSFCLHGPRMVKFMAIWEVSANRILFYNPTGACLQVALLTEAPIQEFAEQFDMQMYV